jgi:hypothetical protein
MSEKIHSGSRANPVERASIRQLFRRILFEWKRLRDMPKHIAALSPAPVPNGDTRIQPCGEQAHAVLPMSIVVHGPDERIFQTRELKFVGRND